MPDYARRLPPSRWPGLRKRMIAVLDFDPSPGGAWVVVKPRQWLEALRTNDGIRKAGFEVTAVTDPARLVSFLQPESPDRAFAIVNPYGEQFPVPSGDRGGWKMLARIREYIRNGGVWIETGGYSFYTCTTPVRGDGRIVGWKSRMIGPGGAAAVGFSCGGFAVDEPPVPLRVTSEGRAWLGPDAARLLEHALAGVQRPFTDASRALVLLEGAGRPFFAGIRLDGWGWLWRLGGFLPPPDVAIPAVARMLEYLVSHPWPAPKPAPPSDRFWSVTIRVAE